MWQGGCIMLSVASAPAVRAYAPNPPSHGRHDVEAQAKAGVPQADVLDVQMAVTVTSVRVLLVEQATGSSAGAEADAVAPAGFPDHLKPTAVAGRILDFVRAAAGGDPERLGSLIEAVETAFAEVEQILGGNVPEVSRVTMELVREGLAKMRAELSEVGPANAATIVEISQESVELAATV